MIITLTKTKADELIRMTGLNDVLEAFRFLWNEGLEMTDEEVNAWIEEVVVVE